MGRKRGFLSWPPNRPPLNSLTTRNQWVTGSPKARAERPHPQRRQLCALPHSGPRHDGEAPLLPDTPLPTQPPSLYPPSSGTQAPGTGGRELRGEKKMGHCRRETKEGFLGDEALAPDLAESGDFQRGDVGAGPAPASFRPPHSFPRTTQTSPLGALPQPWVQPFLPRACLIARLGPPCSSISPTPQGHRGQPCACAS